MKERIQPVAFTWKAVELQDPETGEMVKTGAMVPSARYRKVAERQFGAGGEYILEPVPERNMRLHSRYFATLHEYFQNVPEKMAARWPTEQHFRRWLLIEADWFDEKEFDMISEKHAKGLGTFIRINDPYARIMVRGTKVIVRTAKSQSLKAMGAEDFKQSQKDVLELCEQLVGTPRGVVGKNAGRAA